MNLFMECMYICIPSMYYCISVRMYVCMYKLSDAWFKNSSISILLVSFAEEITLKRFSIFCIPVYGMRMPVMQYSMHNILLGLKPNRIDYRYQTPPASSSRIYSGRGLRWTLGIANSSCHIILKDVMNMISYRCGTTTTSSNGNTSGTYHHYY